MAGGNTVDWKSADASVRLLSAVLAAHPELRLNMKATAEAFGTPCTQSSLENKWKRVVNKNTNAIKAAIKAGTDPATVNIMLIDELARAYGSPATFGGIEFQFRTIKKNAKQLRSLMEAGQDTAAIQFEAAKAFGPLATANSLGFQMSTRWKPNARRLEAAMKSGVCTSTIVLEENKMSVCYGGPATPSAIENRFRKIKQDAAAIRKAVSEGRDPITLPLHIPGEIAKHMGKTESSVEHQFRRLKKTAKQMREGATVGGAAAGSPVTPKKRKSKAKKAKDVDSDDTDDDKDSYVSSEVGSDKKKTPSKKTALNKVASGRVQKKGSPLKNAIKNAIKNGNASDYESEEDRNIKAELDQDFDEFMDANEHMAPREGMEYGDDDDGAA